MVFCGLLNSNCVFVKAYADYYDVMKLTEELVSGLVKSITGGYTIRYHSSAPFFPPLIYSDVKVGFFSENPAVQYCIV